MVRECQMNVVLGVACPVDECQHAKFSGHLLCALLCHTGTNSFHIRNKEFMFDI